MGPGCRRRGLGMALSLSLVAVGQERTYKYYKLLSVKYKVGDEEYTTEVCAECFRRTEKGKVNWSHQELKATNNSGRREADALLRGLSRAIDVEVQDELGMLQLNESILYVRIHCITKATKAETDEDWSALGADRSLKASKETPTRKICAPRTPARHGIKRSPPLGKAKPP